MKKKPYQLDIEVYLKIGNMDYTAGAREHFSHETSHWDNDLSTNKIVGLRPKGFRDKTKNHATK